MKAPEILFWGIMYCLAIGVHLVDEKHRDENARGEGPFKPWTVFWIKIAALTIGVFLIACIE